MQNFKANKQICDWATKRPWEVELATGETDENGDSILIVIVKQTGVKFETVQAYKDVAYISLAVNHFSDAVDRIIDAKDNLKCIPRLTEENDIQRASIQELSGKVAKMQAVVDAAKEIALFGAITNEKQVNSFMRKVATLGQALQNLEAAHEQ
jgi:hypothetical protein